MCIYITYQIKKCVHIIKKCVCIYVCVGSCLNKYISATTLLLQTKIYGFAAGIMVEVFNGSNLVLLFFHPIKNNSSKNKKKKFEVYI